MKTGGGVRGRRRARDKGKVRKEKRKKKKVMNDTALIAKDSFLHKSSLTQVIQEQLHCSTNMDTPG